MKIEILVVTVLGVLLPVSATGQSYTSEFSCVDLPDREVTRIIPAKRTYNPVTGMFELSPTTIITTIIDGGERCSWRRTPVVPQPARSGSTGANRRVTTGFTNRRRNGGWSASSLSTGITDAETCDCMCEEEVREETERELRGEIDAETLYYRLMDIAPLDQSGLAPP